VRPIAACTHRVQHVHGDRNGYRCGCRCDPCARAKRGYDKARQRGMTRVGRSNQAMYSQPRESSKRRRCDGHMAERHWIEAGDLMVCSALPPMSNDCGNVGWWHAFYCMECAPEGTS